jgi:hypothetical protein
VIAPPQVVVPFHWQPGWFVLVQWVTSSCEHGVGVPTHALVDEYVHSGEWDVQSVWLSVLQFVTVPVQADVTMQPMAVGQLAPVNVLHEVVGVPARQVLTPSHVQPADMQSCCVNCDEHVYGVPPHVELLVQPGQ